MDMDMEVDTATPTTAGQPQSKSSKVTTLTRLGHGQSQHYYIYLTVEMELFEKTKKPVTPLQPSILTFRKMLSSAVQDLFGSAMGGGINIDILGYWTDPSKDPYNRMNATSIEPPSNASSSACPTVSVTSTYSSLTTASAVLRSHALDFNQLWNALTLFNTMVDDYDARFEVRYVSSTLLGLQANSRQLKWPN
ncbi:MAG: hypothetical protein J3Q66DRAFT_321215 [Benniella sp.]|nr:MAG: hypothetical protein J3Q66DRAFT_321215 [Benniella sp.]